MKITAAVLLAAVLLAAAPLAAAPPPHLTESVTLFPSTACCSAGSHSSLVVKFRVRYSPIPALHSVGVEDGTLRIRLLQPRDWVQVPLHETWLPVDLAPLDGPGSLPIEVLALDSPDDQEAETLIHHPPSLVVVEPFAKLLAIEPAHPTTADEIVLLADRRSPGGAILIPAAGRGLQIFAAGAVAWPASPDPVPIQIGRLSAGTHRIELIQFDGRRIDFDLVVTEPAPAPQEKAILAGGFEVTAAWTTAAGASGPARLVQPPSPDSALFYFFAPDNWELMIKVLDGCAINGHYWVFGAASTDAGYHLEVRRPESGEIFEVDNPVGRTAPAITEIEAFPCGSGLPAARGG